MAHDVEGAELNEGDASFLDGVSEAGAPKSPETCNGIDDDGDLKLDEGCSLPLVSGLIGNVWFRVDAGRAAWFSGITESVLSTTRLPRIDVEEVARAASMMADLDGDRVVYGSSVAKGYTVVDLTTHAVQFVPIIETYGPALPGTSLEGRYLAYSHDLSVVACGAGYCDETKVYLHDLETGQTQIVASDAASIQSRPLLDGNRIVWWEHQVKDTSYMPYWGDATAASLPYVEGTFERLTTVQPLSVEEPMFFAGGRLLLNVPPAPGLDAYRLLDVASHNALPLSITQGDTPTSMDREHLLLLREPLGRCHLDMMRLQDQASVELDTQGVCPSGAQIEGDFVIWSRTEGQTTDLFWMDIGDLKW